MKKNQYSIVTKSNCSCKTEYQIHQSHLAPEQNTVLSQTTFHTQHHIGQLLEIQPKCCSFFMSSFNTLQLIMYGQNLSISNSISNNKCCGEEIVVLTTKKVLIGRIIKNNVCCSKPGTVIEIRDNQQKIIYQIKIINCQLGICLPKCFGWLTCNTPVVYEIFDSKGQQVGKIQRYSDHCCSVKQRFQINFPDQAETKAKILLMNAISLLK